MKATETIDEEKITIENSKDVDGENIKTVVPKCHINTQVAIDKYADEGEGIKQCYYLQPSEFILEENSKEYDIRIYLQKNDVGTILSIPVLTSTSL